MPFQGKPAKTKLPKEFVATMRAVEGRPPVIDGSIKMNCVVCKVPCWVSPASVENMRRVIYPLKVCCIECINAELNDAKEISDEYNGDETNGED